jgi:hypothetical protein
VLSTAADGLLTRIDLGTGSTTSRSIGDPRDPRAVDVLTASDDGVWANLRDHIVRLDPTSLETVGELVLSGYPTGLAINQGALWVYETGGVIERYSLR